MYKMFIEHCVHPALLAGTNEKAIISVVAYRSNSQRQQIKEKFKSMYGKVGQRELSNCTQSTLAFYLPPLSVNIESSAGVG